MEANPSRDMSVEKLKQPADTQNTQVLQQSADAAASYTKLSSGDAGAIGNFNTVFTSHVEMHTRVFVNNSTQLTTTNRAEENYQTLLTDEQLSKPEHHNGCLEPVDDAYCDILDDAGGEDVTNEAIASHQNVLSAAELLVLFNNTHSEQIAYNNDLSAGIAAYNNNSDAATCDNNEKIPNHIHSRSQLSDTTTTVDVYSELDETMIYSQVDELTSVTQQVTSVYNDLDEFTTSNIDETMMYSEVDESTNVSQQATSVYSEFDESTTTNNDYATVDYTIARTSFSFRHASSKILKAVSGAVILVIGTLLVGGIVVVVRQLLSSASPLISRQAFTAFRHDPITSPGVVDFTDVALNDGQVFDSSKFSPTQSGYFWLAVSVVGFAGQTMTLALVANETTNMTQVTLNVHNAAQSWCSSFVDILFVNKGDGVFVTSKHLINVSSSTNKGLNGENRSYSFIGFELENIMEQPIFAVKSDFGVGGLTMTTFQHGTNATTTSDNVNADIISHTNVSFCSDNCVMSKTDIVPQSTGWYLVSVNIHCHINVNSSIADSESAQNKSMQCGCYGSLKGFYSTNSSMWSNTRSRQLPKASASFRPPEGQQNLETDLVAAGSALIFLHPGDVLRLYGSIESSTTSIELFSVRTLLYEPAHSYKAAWSVLCVNSDMLVNRSYDTFSVCDIIALHNAFGGDFLGPYSTHSENVAYDPDSMAVQLVINEIYYIAFTASFGYKQYTTCSVWQHIQNKQKMFLIFHIRRP